MSEGKRISQPLYDPEGKGARKSWEKQLRAAKV